VNATQNSLLLQLNLFGLITCRYCGLINSVNIAERAVCLYGARKIREKQTEGIIIYRCFRLLQRQRTHSATVSLSCR